MNDIDKWFMDTEAEIKRLEEKNRKLDKANKILDFVLAVLIFVCEMLLGIYCFVCVLSVEQPIVLRATALFSGMLMVLTVFKKSCGGARMDGDSDA